MKKLYKTNNAGKLAAYSAMAGAFVAVGTDANATIVYTDITDVTVGIGEFYQLDLDNDGATDFLMRNVSTTGGNWSFVDVIGNWSSYTYGSPSNQVMGYSGAALSYGSALNAGDPIGPGGDFVYNSFSGVIYNHVWLASVYSGNTYGQFADKNDKYMGVQFVIDGDVHYGWARLDAGVSPTSVTIKDYAYDDVANSAIDAGAGAGVGIVSVPESQVSAYSFGNMINIVVKDQTTGLNTVNVFDLDGRIVYTGSLNADNMNINLGNVTTGIYTLQLAGDNSSVYTKKLYIQN